MLIFEIFVSLWLNECDGCVTLQDPNFVTVALYYTFCTWMVIVGFQEQLISITYFAEKKENLITPTSFVSELKLQTLLYNHSTIGFTFYTLYFVQVVSFLALFDG